MHVLFRLANITEHNVVVDGISGSRTKKTWESEVRSSTQQLIADARFSIKIKDLLFFKPPRGKNPTGNQSKNFIIE